MYYIEVITLIVSVTGGIFALFQWKKTNDYKRADLVNSLICKVRDDEDIATVMDVIDWNDGLSYDGYFHVADDSRTGYKELQSNELMIKIDKTLSHFSYICYLYECHILKKEDVAVFEYGLKRIAANKSIIDFLYSLHHWSNYLGVKCSYGYLIKYFRKNNYISDDFDVYDKERNGRYVCYLCIPD